MKDKDYNLLYDEEEEPPAKKMVYSKTTQKNSNQSINSKSRPADRLKDGLNENSLKEAHKILNDEDEFTKTTANMKEKYTTLQNFNKSLRMNNTKGLDQMSYENDDEFYLDEDFEKEDSKMSTLKMSPHKNTQSSASHILPKEQSNFTTHFLTKSSNPELNLRDKPQYSSHLRSNKTLEEDINLLEKSAEFPVKNSQGTDRRRQLNSSFEKPMTQRGVSHDNKQAPQRPTLAKPLQSTGRIVHAKQPAIATRSSNKLEGVQKESVRKMVNSEMNTRTTSLPRPSAKMTDHKVLKINDKSEDGQLKTVEVQPRHKSSSPLVKKDLSSANEPKMQHSATVTIKKISQKSIDTEEKKTIGLMSRTPYSDKVVSVLNTDVKKRSEQVCLAQNTALRHFIHELNEELMKLLVRQQYDSSDAVPGSLQNLNRSPSRKHKDLTAEIQANNQIISLQSEEMAQLTSRVNRITSATHYLSLNERSKQTKQRIKQLILEKKKLEAEFKKEMYQGPARFFAEDFRKGSESLDKEFLEQKTKFSKIKNEYAMLNAQNSEAGNFLGEQKKHIKELQGRYHKLEKLAEHYNVKIKDEDSLCEDGKPKTARIKELQHKLELFRSCIPVIQKNGVHQIETLQKESRELRAMIDKQSRVLTSLREKHTEIVTHIREEIDKTDMDNDKLQRLKRLMQITKIEEHGSVLRDEVIEHSLDFNNISSFFEGSHYTPTRLKQEISLEISNLAAASKNERNKQDVNQTSDHSTSPTPNKTLSKQDLRSNNANSTSRFGANERKQLVRRSDKPRYKSVERTADVKSNLKAQLQETFQIPSKPNLLVKKSSNTSEIEGNNLQANISSAQVMDTDASDLNQRVRSVSPNTSHNRNNDSPKSKPETQIELKPSSKSESRVKSKLMFNAEVDNLYVTERKFPEETPLLQFKENQATNIKMKESEKTSESNEKAMEDNSKTQHEFNPLNYMKPTFAFRGRMKNPQNAEKTNTGNGITDLSAVEKSSFNPINLSVQDHISNENDKKIILRREGQEKSKEIRDIQDKQFELRLPDSKPGYSTEKSNSQQGELTSNTNITSSKDAREKNQKTNSDSIKPLSENHLPLQLKTQGNTQVLNSISQNKASEPINQNQPYLQVLSFGQSNSNGHKKANATDAEEQTNKQINPNPFEFQLQQPGRLMNLTPAKNNLRIRQNDLGKPIELNNPANIKELTSNNSPNQKQDLKEVPFLNSSEDKPTAIVQIQGSKKESSIVDPFADVGDVNKINFNEKKGLFSMKDQFGQNAVNNKDLIWLKNSNEVSETKSKENTQFNWLGQGSQGKNSSTDRVINLNEEKTKSTQLSAQPSFLSKGNENKYIPTISTDNNFNLNPGSNPSSKKPRMKMNISPNEKKETLLTKAEKGNGNDFFADLEV